MLNQNGPGVLYCCSSIQNGERDKPARRFMRLIYLSGNRRTDMILICCYKVFLTSTSSKASIMSPSRMSL